MPTSGFDTLVAHPPTNPVGIVLSNALAVTIGDAGQAPTQLIGIADPNASTGRFVFGPFLRGAAVVELFGTFP